MVESITNKIRRSRYYSKIFDENSVYIKRLMGYLSDVQSIKVVENITASYLTIIHKPSFYYKKAMNAKPTQYHFTTDSGYKVFGTENPYFIKEIFGFNNTITLLDGGAYIGDTIQQLRMFYSSNDFFIYAFEPNGTTFLKLQKNVSDIGDKVKCYNLGLDNKTGIENFLVCDSGSKITNIGDSKIDVIDAEEFLNSLVDKLPTFIKLDIEGKEIDVLKAMQNYISKNKPDLAVSIYHNLEDLWEIPLLIKEICPEYKIYLRHHSNYITETIVYATIR